MAISHRKPYNFSAGPAILPPIVFERAADAVQELRQSAHDPTAPGCGLSILEMSHRGADFDAVFKRAQALCHEVLEIPATHEVLFLQGGASLQFAMVPQNLGIAGKPAAYVDTGAWSKKAIAEAKVAGEVRVIASSAETRYDRIPELPPPASYADASYVHITSNNTIYGTEFAALPEVGEVPLVVDFSSNIGSRPVSFDRIGVAYAGAQKNLGPSGLTLVAIHRDLVERRVSDQVPLISRYATHVKASSLYNTPNTFGVLVLMLVLEWMRDHGGLEGMFQRNERKAAPLYQFLDESQLFRPHAQPGSRSQMNVVWTLDGAPEAERDAQTKAFLSAANQAGFSGLKGHRSVGGCRASIYNAFPPEGVEALVEFMRNYERQQ
ncbi:MAG: 3-phosphoserine/phosphohydroxythreonine transaminase [Myxococcales bacterium FL481]|nr:MAG: 3-phosphoserine/phosphohydroxythreonine transaminase [Myxococcales bacterium FL481]